MMPSSRKHSPKSTSDLPRDKKDNLLVEVEKVLVGVSVPGFNWASRYGLLAETRGGEAYEARSGKAYRHPPNEEPPKLYPNMKKKYKARVTVWNCGAK